MYYLVALGLIWRRQWQPTPVLLPGNSHGWRSLVGPWGCKESDMTERLHFHFSLSCIGEGNGNPFQCSCLESPRDGGAWWAAIYRVAQSRTQLKQLSSSSSRSYLPHTGSLVLALGSSSLTRFEPGLSALGEQSLSHWTTREIPSWFSLSVLIFALTTSNSP